MPVPYNNIRMIIREKIFEIIKNDLTIGRTDRNLIPLNENEIRQFIIGRLNDIERAIWAMIRDYDDDGDLNQLLEPETDWITEYLYDFIDTTI